MHLNVRTKIVAGLAVIMGMGTVAMLIIYYGLATVRRGLHEVAEVREPSSAAAYEMEINTKGIALGVLKYLESADPQYRRLVEDDQSDFERFHARYLRLTGAGEPEALGDSIGTAYQGLRSVANLLMNQKDRQEVLFAEFGEGFERIDRLIDGTFQPLIDRGGPDGSRKIEILTDLEADVAEVAFWVASYQRTPRSDYQELILVNDREVVNDLAALESLDLTGMEQSVARELGGIHRRMMRSARELLAVEDVLRQQTESLAVLRAEMDRILDQKIQVLTLQSLGEPREQAEADVQVVLDTVGWLIPFFVLAAGVVAVLLIRSMIGPIRRLQLGTEAIQGGNLEYRIDPEGQDEFAVLARRFDEMVARLQTTTVSKKLLEASEGRLQQTVADLRREIHERMEAEREQARLQTSLRRSETMAAMGALVAGVAHEVRNPLQGISSTLDAMDARFGDRAEHQRYREVLRAELDRLNGLMRDLLDYGKPHPQAHAPGSISEVVAEAVLACAPLEQRAMVKIIDRVPPGLTMMLMERSRMLQVFRNLVDNALQNTPPGGTLTLDATEVDGDGGRWIECVVRDSGPGIEPGDLTRIFEPFFSRRHGGTGLGLSIVHRIVEEHGGTISATNARAGGAVFVLRFPTP